MCLRLCWRIFHLNGLVIKFHLEYIWNLHFELRIFCDFYIDISAYLTNKQTKKKKPKKKKINVGIERLTLRNLFYSRLDVRVESKTVDGPMATDKCSTVNMIHAMYNRRLQEGIYPILVHRMQHNNKVLSVKRWNENEKKKKTHTQHETN